MRRISELFEAKEKITAGEDSFTIRGYHGPVKEKVRINILAMGDVGGTLAMALRLLGTDIVSSIGISDLNDNICRRYETELNQISMPCDFDHFPPVRVVPSDEIFDCDVFLFCATKGVPKVGENRGDVRMAQLSGNLDLAGSFAKKAADEGYEGDFFIVSDPVDPLCKKAVLCGLDPSKVKGFGLGVMNARAAYYAGKDEKLSIYRKEGRVFGPHGADLVVADSVMNYDHSRSMELTEKTVNANIEIREMGFKPYIAPACSSGTISVLEDLRGNIHYSSAYFGKDGSGAFLGMRCRRTDEGLLVEDLPLCDDLYSRIERAYRNLEELI